MTPCVRRHANLKCPNFIYSHMWHTHFWYKIQVILLFIVFFCAFLLPNVPDTFVTQPLGGPRIFVYQSPNNTTRHSPLAWILFRNHGFFFMTKTRTWFCSKIRYLTHLVISPTTRYVVINTVCNVSNMFSKTVYKFSASPKTTPQRRLVYSFSTPVWKTTALKLVTNKYAGSWWREKEDVKENISASDANVLCFIYL